MNENENDDLLLLDDVGPIAPPPATLVTAVTPAKPVALGQRVGSVPVLKPTGKVVFAAETEGESFVLKYEHNAMVRSGQMLVLTNYTIRDATLEVLDIHFPEIGPGKPTSGKSEARYYLGRRPMSKEQVPLVMDMRLTQMANGEQRLEYRLLYRSGKPFRGEAGRGGPIRRDEVKWEPLDLGRLKLRTTEAQRAAISVFTGMVYKLRDSAPSKHTMAPPLESQADRHDRQSRRHHHDGVFDRAGVNSEEVMRSLTSHDASVRSHLQRGLQTGVEHPPAVSAGENS